MSRKLIEAALFMSSRAMSAEEISKITGVSPGNVEKTLETLSREYAGEAKGVEIIHVPEGWEMRVKPELLSKVAHLTPYSDLRDGHKRTLALIAYKEPLRQSEAVRIQGNKVYNYIKFLRKKGLIKSEKEGRTVKLSLTKEFERYFGLEKERVKEMLQRGMERAKARDEAKALKAAQEAAEAQKHAAGQKPVPDQKNAAGTKPSAGAGIKPEVKKPDAMTGIASAAQQAATPPTNVQYIEAAPAETNATARPAKPSMAAGAAAKAEAGGKPGTKPEMRPEIKALKFRPAKRKPRRLPRAAKIGTRRPAS